MYFSCSWLDTNLYAGYYATGRRFCYSRYFRFLDCVGISFLTTAIGSNFLIQWDEITGATVNLDLGNGPSGDVNIVENIATGIANSGVSKHSYPSKLTNCRVSNGLFPPRLPQEATTPSGFLGTMGRPFPLKGHSNSIRTDYNFSARVCGH